MTILSLPRWQGRSHNILWIIEAGQPVLAVRPDRMFYSLGGTAGPSDGLGGVRSP